MPQPWSAPVASAPVHATVTIPGSKSITNRALVLAALSGGDSVITNALEGRDADLMIAALRALGVPIDVDGATMTVRAHGGLRGPAAIDCGLAGTVMRFVPPAAALADGEIRFDGDPRARERPMTTVLDGDAEGAQRGDHQVGVAALEGVGDDAVAAAEGGEHEGAVGDGLGAGDGDRGVHGSGGDRG